MSLYRKADDFAVVWLAEFTKMADAVSSLPVPINKSLATHPNGLG